MPGSVAFPSAQARAIRILSAVAGRARADSRSKVSKSRAAVPESLASFAGGKVNVGLKGRLRIVTRAR
jgi:hypothetical protein